MAKKTAAKKTATTKKPKAASKKAAAKKTPAVAPPPPSQKCDTVAELAADVRARLSELRELDSSHGHLPERDRHIAIYKALEDAADEFRKLIGDVSAPGWDGSVDDQDDDDEDDTGDETVFDPPEPIIDDEHDDDDDLDLD
jgi:hypothetical protein